MKRKISIQLAITLMLLASALTLGLSAYFNPPLPFAPKNEIDIASREFAALLAKIDEVYIGEYDVSDLSDAAMRAAVSALEDRWSYYMTQEEYARYLNSSRNQYAGIGVGVSIDVATGGMEVLYIYRGSPAEIAGVLAGDVIIAIDGDDITGLTLTEMRELLARPIGDSALIDLLRMDGAVETISVVYDLVFSDPIYFELIDDAIGYIAIANFDGGTAERFISAVEELLDLGAQAFVYDVRNNAGGRVNEMTRMLDFLLPEGEIFISVDRDGNEEITMSDSSMLDYPALVIVDRYSYSAAEYFAAILSEYDYAEIVGEQTTGKSRMQSTMRLPEGGALHISIGQYFTKDRIALFDIGGLAPDYPLSLSDDEFVLFISGNLRRTEDPQLLLALALAGELIRN